jgi:transposase
MARPYSLDLRERVVSAVASGQTCRAVASNFDVAVSTVVKWVGRVRRTGSVAPGKMGGHRPYILEPERDWLLARLEQKPDLTLHALGAELIDRGVSVSCDTLWRFLKREGISFKKNAARRRTGSARRGPTAPTVEGASGQT